MRKVVTGDQVAQLRNPDPLAFPVWRAPVYRTPGWIIAIAQLGRFLFWLIRLVFRHPVVSLVVAVLGFTWSETGWLGFSANPVTRRVRPASFSSTTSGTSACADTGRSASSRRSRISGASRPVSIASRLRSAS